jgi:hypothetical protein
MAASEMLVRSRNALWAALSAMRIEQPGSRRFEEALAAKTRWELPFAERVVNEYRRFLYLAATVPFEVTPSQAVDEAWHLHLAYSRHYWDVLCARILQRPLHHVPGSGDSADEARFAAQYRDTLTLYQDMFGYPPPADIWPGSAAVPPEPEAEPPAPSALEERSDADRHRFAGIGLLALFFAFGSLMEGTSRELTAILIMIGFGCILLSLPRRTGKEAGVEASGCGASCGGGCGGD